MEGISGWVDGVWVERFQEIGNGWMACGWRGWVDGVWVERFQEIGNVGGWMGGRLGKPFWHNGGWMGGFLKFRQNLRWGREVA